MHGEHRRAEGNKSLCTMFTRCPPPPCNNSSSSSNHHTTVTITTHIHLYRMAVVAIRPRATRHRNHNHHIIINHRTIRTNRAVAIEADTEVATGEVTAVDIVVVTVAVTVVVAIDHRSTMTIIHRMPHRPEVVVVTIVAEVHPIEVDITSISRRNSTIQQRGTVHPCPTLLSATLPTVVHHHRRPIINIKDSLRHSPRDLVNHNHHRSNTLPNHHRHSHNSNGHHH